MEQNPREEAEQQRAPGIAEPLQLLAREDGIQVVRTEVHVLEKQHATNLPLLEHVASSARQVNAPAAREEDIKPQVFGDMVKPVTGLTCRLASSIKPNSGYAGGGVGFGVNPLAGSGTERPVSSGSHASGNTLSARTGTLSSSAGGMAAAAARLGTTITAIIAAAITGRNDIFRELIAK